MTVRGEVLVSAVRIGGGDDVLRFAQRYGILELCEHDQPIMYGRGKCVLKDGSVCRPRGWPGLCWEPIDGWLRFVRQVKAVLAIAAALNQGERPDPIHWANQAWSNPESFLRNGKSKSKAGLSYQRYLVSKAVGEWLQMGDVEPLFTWSRSGPAIGFIGTTCGSLAAQVMFTVSRSQALAVCSGCGQAYLREGKKPQRGRRNFCPACGETVASKLRKRDQRVAAQSKGTI